MKKKVIAVVFCLCLCWVLSSEEGEVKYSYTNNTYQKLSEEYAKKSEAAFNAGNLNDAETYAKQAEENAALSKAYIDKMMRRDEVESLLNEARQRLSWAKENGVDKSAPIIYSSAEDDLRLSEEHFAKEEFDPSYEKAGEVITLLKDVKGQTVLPEYYIVRPWRESKDCLWNIAKRPYVYNNPHLWENIYQVNKDIMIDKDNPNLIAPGMKVKIPSIAGEVREGVYDPDMQYPTFSE